MKHPKYARTNVWKRQRKAAIRIAIALLLIVAIAYFPIRRMREEDIASASGVATNNYARVLTGQKWASRVYGVLFSLGDSRYIYFTSDSTEAQEIVNVLDRGYAVKTEIDKRFSIFWTPLGVQTARLIVCEDKTWGAPISIEHENEQAEKTKLLFIYPAAFFAILQMAYMIFLVVWNYINFYWPKGKKGKMRYFLRWLGGKEK